MTPVYQTPPRPPFYHPTVSRATTLDWLKGAKMNYIQNTSMALNNAVQSGPALYGAKSCSIALHCTGLHWVVLSCNALTFFCTTLHCAALC